jgi:TonB family protein
MKNATGNVKPRRKPVPKSVIQELPKPRVRLDLKPSVRPTPPEEAEDRETSHFWKWVGWVALFHVIVICAVTIFYEFTTTTKPPEQFISLLPDGDIVKGKPGTQEAHKLGPTTAASTTHHSAPPPPPAASAPPKKVVTPVKPPVLKPSALADDNPLAKPTPPKPTPPKPKPAKVKVDLNLQDGPTPVVNTPKLKTHLKKTKPTLRPEDTADDDNDSTTKAESTGLSKEQIAAKLGDKLDAAGIKNATQIGKSGSINAHPNNFSDFTNAIRDQVMDLWKSPALIEQPAVYPVVQIHIEKDGRVPAEGVHLIQSSGNAPYDESAVTAAKNLGYLHEPLPDGCPPDIPITFKLTN